MEGMNDPVVATDGRKAAFEANKLSKKLPPIRSRNPTSQPLSKKWHGRPKPS